MTERDWQRLENTMNFIVEQQAKFEAKMESSTVAFEKRCAAAERRMDRLERFADRAMKSAERRWAKADEDRAELRTMFKSFLQSMRRSQGNGKDKA